ncbi:hypothetical protein EVAR_59495_1 [Eumeta japonica]|uniref:Uncharacterized protein n=1 Tax=Eumeta variegata TaxID=151549 RepID=A0A4C1YHN7_EUMVA|nr:hypothetical protein EVAR_59495_1 [Eumeta japonica]
MLSKHTHSADVVVRRGRRGGERGARADAGRAADPAGVLPARHGVQLTYLKRSRMIGGKCGLQGQIDKVNQSGGGSAVKYSAFGPGSAKFDSRHRRIEQ